MTRGPHGPLGLAGTAMFPFDHVLQTLTSLRRVTVRRRVMWGFFRSERSDRNPPPMFPASLPEFTSMFPAWQTWRTEREARAQMLHALMAHRPRHSRPTIMFLLFRRIASWCCYIGFLFSFLVSFIFLCSFIILFSGVLFFYLINLYFSFPSFIFIFNSYFFLFPFFLFPFRASCARCG